MKNINNTPKIIHQIWVGGEAPVFIEDAMRTVRDLNPDFEYKRWGNDDIDKLGLRDDFNKSTTISFFTNKMRVLILQKYGGVYIDADTVCLVPIEKWFNKYKDYDLSSMHIKNMFPDMGVIIAKPHLDYSLFLNDYTLDKPGSVYWIRMHPKAIPESEIGLSGTVMKDLRLNSGLMNIRLA